MSSVIPQKFLSFQARDNPDIIIGPDGQTSVELNDASNDDNGNPTSSLGDDQTPDPDALDTTTPLGKPTQALNQFSMQEQDESQVGSVTMSSLLLPVPESPSSSGTSTFTTMSSSLDIPASSSSPIATLMTMLPTSPLAVTPSPPSSAQASTITASIPTSVDPSPTPTPSTASHTPPFYVAIVLGSFTGVACIAALVAWWIRTRSHARQRRAIEEEVIGDGGSSRNLGLDDEVDSNYHNTSRQERSEYYLPASIVQMSTTGPFANSNLSIPNNDGTIPYGNDEKSIRNSLADSNNGGLSVMQGPYPLMRPSPTKVISGYSVHESTRTLGPLQIANMVPGELSMSGDESSRPGTRLDMVRTPSSETVRFPQEEVSSSAAQPAELQEARQDVPWGPIKINSGSLRARRAIDGRNDGKWKKMTPPGHEDNFDEVDKKKTEQGSDGWTSTLKTNFLNALGVMGKSNSSGTDEDDKFTPVPRRTNSRGGNQPRWNRDFGTHPITRGHSTSSGVSRLYTLEETGEGMGRVHIRGLDPYNADYASPKPSRSTLGLSTLDGRQSIYPGIDNVVTRESQAPLLSQEVPTASARPRRWTAKRINERPDALSRMSTGSIYSAESVGPNPYNRRAASNPSGLQSFTPKTTPHSGGQDPAQRKVRSKRRERVHGRPKLMERASSSTSSIMSFGSDLMRPNLARNLSSREEFARRALAERRRRMAINARSSARPQGGDDSS